jgi:hypothetical protein
VAVGALPLRARGRRKRKRRRRACCVERETQRASYFCSMVLLLGMDGCGALATLGDGVCVCACVERKREARFWWLAKWKFGRELSPPHHFSSLSPQPPLLTLSPSSQHTHHHHHAHTLKASASTRTLSQRREEREEDDDTSPDTIPITLETRTRARVRTS